MGVLQTLLIVCVVVVQSQFNILAEDSSNEVKLDRRQWIPTAPANFFPAVPQTFIPTFHPCTPTTTRDDGRLNDIPSNVVQFFTTCGTTKYGTKRRDLLNLFKKDKEESKRVVGGAVTGYEGAWPWMVSIIDKSRGHICTGSLIHPRWVLTAAHCVSQLDSFCNYYVQLGENFIMHPTYAGDRQVIQVDRIVKHGAFTGSPDHDKTTPITNDVALLRLAVRATLDADVNTICLVQPGEGYYGNTCTIAGWGNIDPQGTQTRVLKHLTIPPLDWSTCAYYKGLGPWALNAGQICLSNTYGADACNGDSGGPYICKSMATNRWVQIGLTSYGADPCGEGSTPTVYTNTLAYLPWIQSAIARHGGL